MGDLIHLTGATGTTTGGTSLVPTGAQGLSGTHYLIIHNEALQRPRGVERPLVALRAGILQYAVEYENSFEGCKLGGDAILGDAWINMARGYIALLNGPTGRLDCGTLDGEVRRWAAMFGFDQGEVDSL